ncbi:MAG: hypothetical protein JSW64_15400 [Candidatus Zixiibacteriota bacterium]|nr:MAG: hypothetical protein JSW64_15400 [candidate division Zixibacteria bacterium]
MKCEDFRKRIDLEFGGSSLEIDSALRSHIESCEKCGLYYKEILRLREILNSQDFEVLPGELDDITFDKIIQSPGREDVKAGILESIFSLRWAWVPAAVAAILVMFVIFPNRVNHDTETETVKIIDWSPPFSTYVPEELDSRVLSSFDNIEDDLELMEEVLLYDSGVDNLIESLSDEEFDILYERLNYKSGSA